LTGRERSRSAYLSDAQPAHQLGVVPQMRNS
jgi:hypothetical protein